MASCSLFRKWLDSAFIFSPPAILVIVWDTLMYLQMFLVRYFAATYFSTTDTQNSYSSIVFDTLYCTLFLTFPFLGLLSDVWIGRYRTILSGIILCFIAWILAGMGYIVKYYLNSTILFMCLFGLGYLLEVVGHVGLRSNIIQYNIDQLLGSSATKLSIVIYWHSASVPMASAIFQLGRCLLESIVLPAFVISGITVSIVLVTHSFFKQWLENVPLTNNPVKLIIKVLQYVRKHKYPENRSALTYWEEEAPSRLDLGKEKYGGPFTDEEVEDVKTVFRMLPLFIGTIGLACTDEVYWNVMSGPVADNSSISTCLISSNFWNFLTSTVKLFLDIFLIQAFFHKYIPSMLKRISVGLFFALVTMLCSVLIFTFFPNQNSSLNSSSYYNNLLVIPQILFGITFAIIFPTALEFTIAQSPVQMRGMMVGIWFACIGIGYFININAKYPFGCHNEYICTSSYYYLTKGIIVLFILIVFVILGKRYKFRVRGNEVNIHQIVDDHYQRYMEQEDKIRSNEITIND